MRSHRQRFVLTTVVVLVTMVMSSFATAVAAQEDPPAETTPTEAPPTDTEPPETTPPDGETPEEEDSDGSDSTSDWGIVLLAAGAAVVLVVALVAAVSGRQRSDDARRAATQRAGHDRLQRIVGGAEWVHDQISLELLAPTMPADRLRMAWDDSRRRMHDLGREVTTMAVNAPPDVEADLRNLSRALGGLIGALDTNVELRTAPAAPPEEAEAATAAIRASNEAVDARRRDLANAVERIRYHL